MTYIKENLVIERYLQGTLSKEESEAFEEAYLASPELLDQLEAAERLKQGLRDLHASQEAHGRTARAGVRRGLFHSPRYAMAATVLLAVSVAVSGGLYLQNRSLSDTPAGIPAAAQIVFLETVRGAEDDPFNVLERGDAGGQFVLMVDPGFEPYSHFRVTLSRMGDSAGTQPLLQLDNLQPGFEDMLAISMPADLLEPGDYAVRIDGWRSEWPANQAFEPANRVTFRVK